MSSDSFEPIQEGIRILRQQGPISLGRRTLAYLYNYRLRPYLPKTGYIERGLPIEREPITVDMEEKLLDRWFPWLDDRYRPHTRIELGLRLGHLALTQPGDHVGIVGGGIGITATTAAHQVGASGQIVTYDGLSGEEEGSRFGVAHIERTTDLNGVGDRCDARLGIVGTKDDTIEGYSRHMDYEVPQIHPTELPDFDILECDCNGMELDILHNMDIRPRALIIELEAPHYKEMWGGEEHPCAVLDCLDDLGYTIVKQHGHEGRPLSPDELRELIDWEYETASNQQLESGPKDSPVVLAVRNDYCN